MQKKRLKRVFETFVFNLETESKEIQKKMFLKINEEKENFAVLMNK